MQHIYIDESGSMTDKHTKKWPYFVIALVLVTDRDRAKRVLKRYIAKYMDRLKALDVDSKMFLDGKFHELKGSCLGKNEKLQFVEYMCRNNLIKVMFIRIDNNAIKYGLYYNTARAFNYVLGLAMDAFIECGVLQRDSYWLHIDERNQKTGTTNFLEEYLNIKFVLDCGKLDEIKVNYYDSSQNALIQIADVFSNTFYCNCINHAYSEALKAKRKLGYFPGTYCFPEKKIYLGGALGPTKNVDSLSCIC